MHVNIGTCMMWLDKTGQYYQQYYNTVSDPWYFCKTQYQNKKNG